MSVQNQCSSRTSNSYNYFISVCFTKMEISKVKVVGINMGGNKTTMEHYNISPKLVASYKFIIYKHNIFNQR